MKRVVPSNARMAVRAVIDLAAVRGSIGTPTPIAHDKNPFPEPPPRTP